MRLQSLPNHHRSRRGVTLVEMLVTLAVLLLMMTAIVQIFQAATGTLSASRAYQDLDTGLRRLDGVIRTDFAGITANLTPPVNPKDNRGYFEYGENAFADLQGEDSDDYVRFTAKSPVERPFIGRFWPIGSTTPISISSQYAEIIYFLRNGNLYRRVLLIAPERQKSVVQMTQNVDTNGNVFPSNNLIGVAGASWQGLNDISARPSASGIVLNTLADLTNRENRAFAPRFSNDFFTLVSTNATDPTRFSTGPDLAPDDLNSYGTMPNVFYGGDGVPDFYPTLYADLLYNGPVHNSPLIYEGGTAPARTIGTTHVSLPMAFPYLFPGSYSHPDPYTTTLGQGWLHSPTPDIHLGATQGATSANYPAYLQQLNHNPLDVGDNLPRPVQRNLDTTNTLGGLQTWWGFPTWRETLAFTPATASTTATGWTDPTQPINTSSIGYAQPPGLTPRYNSNADLNSSTGAITDNVDLLPPMTYLAGQAETVNQFNVMRLFPQLYSDGLGGASSFMNGNLWYASWEDDLIMTGVRSFDIKALDNSLGDYVDLGWGDDARLPIYLPNGITYYAQNGSVAPFLTGNPSMDNTYTFNPLQFDTVTSFPLPKTGALRPTLYVNNQPVDLLNGTFAHEGRMPPLVADNRLDAQFANPTYGTPNYVPDYAAAYPNYSSNIGDDSTSIVRMRRVWDSWSTDYTSAPAKGYDPQTKAPTGPPFLPPVYPSYPPPYPAPMRGLQIQIRVQDPTGKYVKSLTIRQDFTEKL